ncbi:ribosome recycling factor family protein [Vibrio marisflavi]|uniref:Ribosome recycling factor n=1 Tax=Vibrio marisflavi CECT 7928 TaxID=634439 RepID=A0ABM8ZYN0_9VIBR|nr:ribosome recycling factor family protein [Vibrio marisflavi]CAH0536061.1 hypothetical protein VMF7928_00157 [Vibrio marisflavi CECT 7928]
MSLIAISLPSLIHRIGGEHVKTAKLIAENNHCQLKRVRRSRNWQLIGTCSDILQFIDMLAVESDEHFAYLINKIKTNKDIASSQKETVQTKLESLIQRNPSITLAELVQLTGCTLVQARAARLKMDSL